MPGSGRIESNLDITEGTSHAGTGHWRRLRRTAIPDPAQAGFGDRSLIMTAILDPATAPTAPESPVRLSLAPQGVRAGRLDGAWWPRSRDLLLELPSLAAEIDERWG
ncbi:DUF5994 family protein, partial [Kitasatospora sp. NPDC085895]|uniref:DUF5994 family protein n=1 Tax=Kitasatospora sp. NPDC085895 TaxID=3155057 RepID=UPI003450C5A0